MRARAPRWSILLLTLLACKGNSPVSDAGEPPVQESPKILKETEPNDRAEEALTLSENSIVEAGLGADPQKPDEDWYRLDSPFPRQASLKVSGIPGVDVALEVLDRDRNRLVSVDSEGPGKPERLPHLSVRGPVYVRVLARNRGTGGAYRLEVEWAEEQRGAEQEPNDRGADANTLTLGAATIGRVGHATDEDWYRLELSAEPTTPDAGEPDDAGGVDGAVALDPAEDGGSPPADGGPSPIATEPPGIPLRIELAGVSGVRLEVQLLSAAEAPLFGAKGKEGEGLLLRNVGVRENDRTVYLVVKSMPSGTGKEAKRGYSADLPYSLTVRKEEAGTGASAESEPNDSRARATPLPLNGHRDGFLTPKGDVDYFVLRTEKPSLARFALSGVERVDTVLTLVDANDKELLKSNDGALKEAEQLNQVACHPECFVRVEGASKKVDGKLVRDYENPEQPYRLTVATVPDDGSWEREPNGTPATASPISVGKATRGTIHPKRDKDFYRLDLSSESLRSALRITLSGILKVDVGLYLYRLDSDGDPQLVQTSDRASGELPESIRYSAEAGIYLLEVRDSKRNESNFQDAYQLRVDLED